MNDSHYSESKEDWEKRINKDRNKWQYEEDIADDKLDEKRDKEV